MTSLQQLHNSMMQIGKTLQKFRIEHGAASFDCLFSVRESPFVLALTSRGLNPSFFKFEVTNGYWIKERFEEEFYFRLLKVLRSGANTGVSLTPSSFLEQLNSNIPTTATPNDPSKQEIIALRPDLTEDRDKPYFDTWIYWEHERYKDVPSKQNQLKTLLLIDEEALQYSLDMKASSSWSADDLNRDWKQQCR